MTNRAQIARLSNATVLVGLLASPSIASADITAFLGTSLTPGGRLARGAAVGTGLVVVGFELEVAQLLEQTSEPSLTTGMVNVLLQTPLEVSRTQFYATTGVGLYRERFAAYQETSTAANIGGGAKIRVTGPLKLRLDYRLFRLRGEPFRPTVHRLYAGATLGF